MLERWICGKNFKQECGNMILLLTLIGDSTRPFISCVELYVTELSSPASLRIFLAADIASWCQLRLLKSPLPGLRRAKRLHREFASSRLRVSHYKLCCVIPLTSIF